MNDSNWSNVLNLLNMSMNTLTNQLNETSKKLQEKESELKTIKEKHEKEVSEMKTKYEKKIRDLELRLKPIERNKETVVTRFDFNDVSKPQSYASMVFKRACHQVIEKFNLTTNDDATKEERLESKRNREEAAREVLAICGFHDINESMLTKTRTRITAVMSDARYYKSNKDKIQDKRAKKRKLKSNRSVEELYAPVSSSTTVSSSANVDIILPVCVPLSPASDAICHTAFEGIDIKPLVAAPFSED